MLHSQRFAQFDLSQRPFRYNRLIQPPILDNIEECLDNNQFRIGKKILEYQLTSEDPVGGGGEGHVFRAIADDWESPGSGRRVNLAIKRANIKFDDLEDTQRILPKLLQNLREEMLQTNHPNLVRYYSARWKKNLPCVQMEIVMEYCSGGTLRDLCEEPLPEETFRTYSKDILEGLAYLHQNNILHCDVKPENILVYANHLKIAALDNSIIINNDFIQSLDVRDLIYSTFYFSPEMAAMLNFCQPSSKNRRVGLKTDVWSYGCVLLDMLLGYKKWSLVDSDGKTVPTEEKIEFTDLVRFMNYGGHPEIPNCPVITPRIKQLLDKCFQHNPENRYSSEILRGDVYFSPLRYFATQVVSSGSAPSTSNESKCSVEITSNGLLKLADEDLDEGNLVEHFQEMKRILESKEMRKMSSSPIMLILRAWRKDILELVKNQLSVLEIRNINGWSSRCLENIALPNLIQLNFRKCENLTLRLNNWNNLINLRSVGFDSDCSFAYLEKNIFEKMKQLSHVQLSEWPFRGSHRWLHEYFERNAYLISRRSYDQLVQSTDGLIAEYREPIPKYYVAGFEKPLINGIFGYIDWVLPDSWEVYDVSNLKFGVRLFHPTNPLRQALKARMDNVILLLKEQQTEFQKHIVNYISANVLSNADNLGYIMEFHHHKGTNLDSDLSSGITKSGIIDENILRDYCRQILEGLAFIHERDIVHTDLRPSKIFIKLPGPILKIGGLDTPLILEGRITKLLNSPDLRKSAPYFSPEMAEQYLRGVEKTTVNAKTPVINVSVKSDLWSFGCLACRMTLGLDRTIVFRNPASDKYFNFEEGTTVESLLDFLVNCGGAPDLSQIRLKEIRSFVSFVSICLRANPEDRLSAKDLLGHSFLCPPNKLEPDIELARFCTSSCKVSENVKNGLLLFVSPLPWSELNKAGNYELYLNDMKSIFQNLRSLNSNRRFAVSLYRESDLRDLLKSDTSNIAVLSFEHWNGWESELVDQLRMPNLVEIRFFDCEDIVLEKGHLYGMLNLKSIALTDSSLLKVEERFFEDLPELKHVGLYLRNETRNRHYSRASFIAKINHRRTLCWPEFEWMRLYFQQRPHLTTPKAPGAIWSVGNSTNCAYRDQILEIPQHRWKMIDENRKTLPKFRMLPFNIKELYESVVEKFPSLRATLASENGISFKFRCCSDAFELEIPSDGGLWRIRLWSTSSQLKSLLEFIIYLDLDYPFEVSLEMWNNERFFMALRKTFYCVDNWLVKMLSILHHLILHLIFDSCNNVSLKMLSGLVLPNLLQLTFQHCLDIFIYNGNLKTFGKFRALVIKNSNVVQIEENAFDNLANLQYLALDYKMVIKSPKNILHLERFHQSAEYEWLRTYLKNNPLLTEPKAHCELWDYGFINGTICGSFPMAAGEAFMENWKSFCSYQ